jgi:hypothetical protein
MKKILLLFFTLSAFFIAKADDEKYIKAMEKNLSMIDTASSLASFQQVANNFERIANAEKDKWLPYYYSAYLLTMCGAIDTVASMKDTYLDKADVQIQIADSLEPDNSEIYTIKGMIAQIRLSIDPQNRWMKYGQFATNSLSKAKELDPTNPRPDLLNGQGVLYTPAQFGGGKEKALPILKEAEKKYEIFQPESSIHPNWGKEYLKGILERIEGEE